MGEKGRKNEKGWYLSSEFIPDKLKKKGHSIVIQK